MRKGSGERRGSGGWGGGGGLITGAGVEKYFGRHKKKIERMIMDARGEK